MKHDKSDAKILRWFEKTWAALNAEWATLKDEKINPFDHHHFNSNNSSDLFASLQAIMSNEKLFRVLITEHALEVVRAHIFSVLEVKPEDLELLNYHFFNKDHPNVQSVSKAVEDPHQGAFLTQQLKGVFHRALNLLNLH
ncbi:hypothetical protein Ciccas_009049 [Cichlidogyrus casuarinus]|uniref:Uncharacterized protein n=1 Tax=Cichlidogyrus casuarinus TaxID=1844966 RepID=A0ABD2PY62_9PLAT